MNLVYILLLAPEAPTPKLLNPTWGIAIWTTLVFATVAFILAKYAWKPITKALGEREDKIQESMDRAENALAEAKKISSDNEKARREAELEAQKIIGEAREAADKVRSDEVDKTKVAIKQMQMQAQADIEQEKLNAISQLRKEVADLAIQSAEKILTDNMDSDKNRKLIDTFIDGLPKN